MSYETKIFRGTCADVAREMNEWFSANEIVIGHVLQTEQSMNVLTVTVIYHLTATTATTTTTKCSCKYSNWQHAREGDPRLEVEDYEIGQCYVAGCKCVEYDGEEEKGADNE